MADFEMRNFHHFPVEKSSYDLKLELLEELDPKEATELMKANNGFRSIYLRDPGRIFGRHVHSIHFTRRNTIEIYKLRQTAPFICDLLFPLPLLKRIKSCRKFDCQRSSDTAREMLTNLDSIGEWENWVFLESFKECFWNFKGQITDRIYLDLGCYYGEENEPTLSVLWKAFKAQLGRCKRVQVNCRVDQFSVIFKLFSKTRVEWILCYLDITKQLSLAGLEIAIRWIVDNGIPGQNREASIWIRLSVVSAYYTVEKLLSTFPGMQQMPDEKNMRSYRRKFDDERDCVYQLEREQPYLFSAKYVLSQTQ